MFPLCHCSLVAYVFLFAIVVRTVAQEAAPTGNTPAGTEKTYLDLRQSEDSKTQLMADRYYNLVRQQEWTALDNKSKVLAKYVAHDPDLKWVKLARVSGSGTDRVTRVVTVPLDKLNKTCQSRVKQIATLQPKLDELAAAEPDTAGSDVADAGGEYGRRPRGRAMTEERGAYGGYGGYDSEATESAASEVAASEQAVPPVGTDADTGADDPDPLGFGELANEPPLETSANYGVGPPSEGYAAYSGGTEGAPVGPADRSQWANSYNAFLANITAATNEGGSTTVDWGGLTDLRAMNDAATEHARDSSADPYRSKISEIGGRLGEVRWQGMFAGVEAQEAGGPVVRFNYLPLPEPLKIRFIADESEASIFSEMQHGQIVQFTGRFDIKTPNEIDVYIHLAN